MKLDPKTRHQDLAQHINDQLEFIPVEDVKSSVIIFVFIMYDVLLILGLLIIFRLEFLWFVLSFVIINHLCAMKLIIYNPYSTQFEVILFMWIWGALGAFTLFILVQGMLYYTLQIFSLFFYIIINVTSIVLIYFCIKYQFNKYGRDPTKERKRGNQSKYIGVLTVAPAIGLILGQSIQETVILKHVISTVVIYFFSILLFFIAAKFLHRYFFIKVNMKYVIYQTIFNKERAKKKKQSIKIKKKENKSSVIKCLIN